VEQETGEQQDNRERKSVVSNRLKERMGDMISLGKNAEGFEMYIRESHVVGFESQKDRINIFTVKGAVLGIKKEKLTDDQEKIITGTLMGLQ